MSDETLYANLPNGVQELLKETIGAQAGVSQSENERKELESWISKASDGSVADKSSLQGWNTELTSKTYLVGNSLTAADVALYGVLHPLIGTLKPEDYYSVPAVTRYFDHIQNDPTVRASSAAPKLVDFDLDGAPKLERKVEAPVKKKKDKVAEGAAPATDPTAAAAQGKKGKGPAPAPTEAVGEAVEAPAAEDSTGKGKKEKKAKKEKEPASATAAGEGKKNQAKAGSSSSAPKEADAGEPVPSMIDLRVGHLVDIKVHPDADGLYVEQIDLGEETGPRTVISGLVHYIPIEKMRDRDFVVVCNLKPANMRGIKSHAMLLCATSKDGKDAGIEAVVPPPGSKVGERIYFEGFEDNEPLSQLNPKKKIFETIQPNFITLDTHEAAWVDPATKTAHRIRTKDGVCMAPSLVGASLS